MAKLTLNDLTNITGQETSAINTVNDNNQLIEDALENTLSLDGTTPNSMLADLDMDMNDIINVNNIDVISITIDGVELSNELYSVGPPGPTGPQGPAGTTSPSASTTVPGILEVAELSELLAGTPSDLAVVSQHMKTIIDMVCPVGTVSSFLRNTAPTYWIALDGKTIGNASSGATGRANADTSVLFSLLWSATSEVDLPIYTSTGVLSTKGANAATDFAANKRLALPDLRGEFVRGWDNSRGIDVGRTLGSIQTDLVKNHVHPGTTESSGTHTHPITPNSDDINQGAGNRVGNNSGGATQVTINTGSGGAHTHTFTTDNNTSGGTENRPRNVSLLYCIRY